MSYAQNYLKMDKIDRLIDAIDHPDRYTGKEIEALLADPEVKEVYDLLDKTKAVLTPISTSDVEAEWEAFKIAHPATQRRTMRILNLFTRNMAASIAIGIASLAAVAAVVGVSANYVLDRKADARATEIVEVAKENIVVNDTIAVSEETSAIAPQTIVFDNEQLEDIANRIAEYYGHEVVFSTEAPKSLRLYFRWNQAQTLDEVIESLNNFEQIHISVKGETIKID